jgi:hypothetical protein
MTYRLKSNCPAFDVVDGPDEGRQYRPGQTYEKIPAGHEGSFEDIPASVTTEEEAT